MAAPVLDFNKRVQFLRGQPRKPQRPRLHRTNQVIELALVPSNPSRRERRSLPLDGGIKLTPPNLRLRPPSNPLHTHANGH
ncbi:hypothetical protein FHU30_001538 [Actinomadura rupiterrae]|nr:hypothetical protein [Actinomadura rupiterrae]